MDRLTPHDAMPLCKKGQHCQNKLDLPDIVVRIALLNRVALQYWCELMTPPALRLKRTPSGFWTQHYVSICTMIATNKHPSRSSITNFCEAEYKTEKSSETLRNPNGNTPAGMTACLDSQNGQKTSGVWSQWKQTIIVGAFEPHHDKLISILRWRQSLRKAKPMEKEARFV